MTDSYMCQEGQVLLSCSQDCSVLLSSLLCVTRGMLVCVLVFAAVVSKLEKKQKFSKCRETLIFLL